MSQPAPTAAAVKRATTNHRLLTELASLALPSVSHAAGRSIGKVLGVKESSLADLVHAADAAATFLQSASAELRARSASSRPDAGDVPFLLATSSTGMVKAVLGDDSLRRRVSALEEGVQISISPRNRGGVRLKHMRGRTQGMSLNDAKPHDGHCERALTFLESEGLVIQRQGRFGITAKGPARLLANLLGVPLCLGAAWRAPVSRSMRLFASQLEAPLADDLFVAPRESLSVSGQSIHPSIDDFVFMPPPRPAVTAVPPSVHYPCLGSNAMRRHLQIAEGGTVNGRGVKVAVIDSGFFVGHPYFAQGGFDFEAVDPGEDQTGHGTAMAWNILNVAPGCSLRGYRHEDPGGAIERASDDGARIISCSWGWPEEQIFPLVELSIRSVIEEDGAVMLFASGNGERYWPSSHPLAIAVGGVHADPSNGTLQASDFASGFHSGAYPDRIVPDISGLCGLAPRGIYLPLPVPPGCELDVSFFGGSYPEMDETAIDDGWIYNSGTSSATAQVAGIVALMTQRAAQIGKTLQPTQVRACLERSAVAVEQGRNAFGTLAVGTPNTAVGWGLASAAAALREVERL